MANETINILASEVSLYREFLETRPGYEAREHVHSDLKAALGGYKSRFDRGPTANLVLDPDGVIVQSNRTAARLLDDGSPLLGRQLSAFAASSGEALSLRRHVFAAFSTRQLSVCKVGLLQDGGATRRVRVESIADPHQKKCLTALVDLQPAKGQGGLILVADDERLLRLAIRHYLERAGYEVIEVGSLSQAVQVCAERADGVELLITDVLMPQLSGTELAAQLLRLLPGLPVMYMSAHSKARLVEARSLDPSDLLLEKPFSEADLLAAATRAIDR